MPRTGFKDNVIYSNLIHQYFNYIHYLLYSHLVAPGIKRSVTPAIKPQEAGFGIEINKQIEL